MIYYIHQVKIPSWSPKCLKASIIQVEPRYLLCEIKNVITMDSPGADGFRPEVSYR